MLLNKIKKEIRDSSNQLKAKILQSFFKTKKGEYGEGDLFLGLTVPTSRTIAQKYILLSLSDLTKLIQSKYHEERLIALLILIEKYSQENETGKTKIHKFYLNHTKWINNWDLVDLSAPKIVGHYQFNYPEDKNKDSGQKYSRLFKLANSKKLWERRIAIVSTYYLIKKNQYGPTLEISKLLLKDKEDLIHKAVGWMLREVGKESVTTLTSFLKKYYKTMPRTMLRYAIERFSPEIRQAYLKGEI